MRVSCPNCKKRFDVPHVAVLAEARRLKERAAGGDVCPTGASGNVIDPADADALECRAEAIRRRQSPPQNTKGMV